MDNSKKIHLKTGSVTPILPTSGATGTWLYGGYPGSGNDGNFDVSTWLKTAVNTINFYNSNGSNKLPITQVYAYASDMELPWTAQGTSPTYWDKTANYGYYFLDSSAPIPPQLVQAAEITKITDLNIIIDGRIDNNYLQGFNDQITLTDANNFATLVVSGGTSQGSIQPGVASYGPNQKSNKPVIKGVQFDLEPFDSNSLNQLEFYHKAGNLLGSAGQYYSIFIFPRSMTQATADMLNGSSTYTFSDSTSDQVRNNGYVIISLYDMIDMTDDNLKTCQSPANLNTSGINTSGICDVGSAPLPITTTTGDKTGMVISTSVPHSLPGYYNAALLAVQQTIALAKKYNISYKFAIPGSASVHEFEDWGTYACKFTTKYPSDASCTETSMTTSSKNTQLDYIKKAIKAIQAGFNGKTDPLFLGIDVYAFAFKQVWSPQMPTADWNSNYYYGNTCTFVTDANDINPAYIYTEPSNPNSDVLNYLSSVTTLIKPPLD